MGLTCNFIGFRHEIQKDVVDALVEGKIHSDCYVSPSINCWVTVLDRECDPYYASDNDPVRRLAATVCRRCRCRAISLSVCSSTILWYRVFGERGEIIDESVPPVDDQSFEGKRGLLGDLRVVAELAPERRISAELLRHILSDKHQLLETVPMLLGRVLGNLHMRMGGYHEYAEEPRDEWNDVACAAEFLHIDDSGNVSHLAVD